MRCWRTSMRTIDRSTRFKRDYKRESKGRHRATLDADLLPVLAALATDTPLDPKYRDHELSGDWAGYRDCHVKHDLVRSEEHTSDLQPLMRKSYAAFCMKKKKPRQ